MIYTYKNTYIIIDSMTVKYTCILRYHVLSIYKAQKKRNFSLSLSNAVLINFISYFCGIFPDSNQNGTLILLSSP